MARWGVGGVSLDVCFACITVYSYTRKVRRCQAARYQFLDTSCGGCADGALGGGLEAITSDVIGFGENR
jgi:hypothetical protein